MKTKLSIKVEPLEDGKYVAVCNWDDFREECGTKNIAIFSAYDHYITAHPKEAAKRGRRSKAASERRGKKAKKR